VLSNYSLLIIINISFLIIGCNTNDDNLNDTLTNFQSHKVEYIQDTLPSGVLAPKLAIIPAGINRLGTDDIKRPENERPSYLVDIKEPFAIGVTEVTFAEYDLYSKITGSRKPKDKGWGRGQLPVIYVTWYDAQFYVEWLTEQTGKNTFYHLKRNGNMLQGLAQLLIIGGAVILEIKMLNVWDVRKFIDA